MTDKEFWEKCGLNIVWHNNQWEVLEEIAEEAFGATWQTQIWRPLPQMILDNLFKYAVPKLKEMGYGYSLSNYLPQDEMHRAELYNENTRKWVVKWDDTDPAQALRKAIEEVIGNG